jgi:hypothetical protein
LPQGLKSFSRYGFITENLKGRDTEDLRQRPVQKKKQEILEGHQKRYQAEMDSLDSEAASRNLMVQLSPMGAAVVPVVDGKPLAREEFLKLS